MVPHRVLVVAIGLLATALGGCAVIGLPVVHGCWRAWMSAPGPQEPWLGRLVVLGDFGANHEDRNLAVANALRDYLETTPAVPTRVLLMGDNFYPRGLVGLRGRCHSREGLRERVAAQLRDVLEPFAFLRARGITVLAIPGNHDHGCGQWALDNQKNLDSFLPAEQRWGTHWQFVVGEPQAFWSGDGRLQVVLLDSEPMVQSRQALVSSVQTMEELLQEGAARASWQLVAAHHPLRTNGTHDGAFPDGLRKPATFLLFPSHFLAAAGVWLFSALWQDAYSFAYQCYRRELERAFLRHPGAADLFLAGHDHNLQLLPPREPHIPPQLIAGKAAYCSPVRKETNAWFAAPKHGFAVVLYDHRRLQVEFYGTSPCGDERSCDVGDGRAHLLYRRVLKSAGSDGDKLSRANIQTEVAIPKFRRDP